MSGVLAAYHTNVTEASNLLTLEQCVNDQSVIPHQASLVILQLVKINSTMFPGRSDRREPFDPARRALMLLGGDELGGLRRRAQLQLQRCEVALRR
jgi:hypothetical protein